ncbi:hypothetical protein [Fulvivirga sediminis]|uniref:Uncharacterized protein n=1 Tax=Fulvivirga sediminis TaxID=2803949 RepID=A0A937F8H4_9BACT|nr:hypothetical protein [Fulvivirga sediminis]MBL3658266.1 hypothetical protein [Fulvivirga sediminis]
MLHPKAQGRLNGRIAGLDNSNDGTISDVLSKEKREVSEYNLRSGYLTGFEEGYESGQKLRTALQEDVISKLPFQEKVKCLSFLLKQQERCRADYTQSFMANIIHWEEANMPVSLKSEIEHLLREDKIQRSVDKLFQYFKDHYQLKAFMEFHKLYDQLKKLRTDKKNNKNQSIAGALQGLKNEILRWVE